jgi:DNA-binding NarL/FixJ family response regulator
MKTKIQPRPASASSTSSEAAGTKILLLCHDLTTRLRLGHAWSAAGVTMLHRTSSEAPDCIVIDLGRRDALAEIVRLRTLYPEVDIITCAATFDGAAVEAASAAGATDFAARAHVAQRVQRRLKLPG